MKTVINSNGTEIAYNVAVSFMDDDIREKLASCIAPCSEQDFFEAYALAHELKFGEVWECDKKNPCI